MSIPSSKTSPPAGARSADALHVREEYLQTGKIPWGAAIRKGTRSLVADPWLLIVRHMPGPLGFFLRRRYFRRKLGGLGKGVLIDPGVFLIDPQNVYLDDFCYVGTAAQLVAPEGFIQIGKRCHVTGRILGHGGVRIGDYVGAAGAILSATDSYRGGFRMAGPMLPPEQRHIRYGKVTVEDDAFLSAGSVVLPGVTIGQGAVVGPNTLVATHVAPWTVVLGTPARVIAQRPPVTLPRPD